VLAALAWGRAEILMRPRDSIATTSPFVEDLKSRVKGARYAGAGDVVSRLLPPNQESVLGLSSIHSFNSLSSRAYQDWVTRVSETGTRTYGRQFRKITSAAKLGDGELALAGVGVIASEIPLESPAVERVGEFGSVTFYKPREAPVFTAIFARFTRDADGVRVENDPAQRRFAGTINPQDDYLRIGVAPTTSEELLFVSQQHHPQWRASADGRELETVVVNGFYQGVIVPAGVSEVKLVFQPWSLWMWIPQLAFVLAALVCAADAARDERVVALAGAWPARAMPVLALVLAVAALAWRGEAARQRHAQFERLALPGARLLRMEPARAAVYRELVAALAGADYVVTTFRGNSLALWRGAKDVSPADFSSWPLRLAPAAEQARVTAALQSARRPMVVRRRGAAEEASAPGAVDWIERHFAPSREIGPYTLLERREDAAP